jgi:hypothetical protein
VGTVRSGLQLDLANELTTDSPMTAVAARLDQKLQHWDASRATEVERLVGEIIEWADAEALDLMRSRQREQEVLDLLDEPQTR